MSEKIPLGQLITGEAHRDAIHVALAPMTAKCRLRPGDHVDAEGGMGGDPVGIVDPYLAVTVAKGDRFYACLYPNTVTSLRHQWTHPAFEDMASGTKAMEASSADEHEGWIRRFADDVRLGYDQLLEAADLWLETHDGKWGGDCLNLGSHLSGTSVPAEFWDHYDKVRGVETPTTKRDSFFSCSC